MKEEPVYYSIVIPTYNRAHLVGKAIESVLHQTYPYFELIVSDDASTDDTEAVVQSYNDERIRYIKAAVNKGNAATRNAGVQMAVHPVIAFLDSDDRYKPDYLQRLHEVFRKAPAGVGMVWCGLVTVNEADAVLGEGYWDPGTKHQGPYQFFYDLKMGTNCGFAVRRSFYDEVGGFDEQLRAAVDTDFLLRLGKLCSFHVIPENLVYYQFSDKVESVRKNRTYQSEAYDRILVKHPDVWNSNPGLRQKWFYKAFWLSYYAKDKTKARRYFRQLKLSVQVVSVFLIFECLPFETAKRIHHIMTSKGFGGLKNRKQ